MRVASLAFIVWGFTTTASPALAGMTQKDVLVATRALGFMENAPHGTINVGIVYAPGNKSSAQDAENTQELLGDGLKVGNLTLRPVMVSVDDIAGANVYVFFLSDGVEADGAKVAAASRTRRIPCVTTDVAQVKNGSCVLGVRSQPKVEILVNRAAAAASGVVFAGVFRMMITEF